jgi:hypothetical protein
MTDTLTAKFDGKAFLPEQTLDLKPDTRYRLRVEEELPAGTESEANLWDFLESVAGTVKGPPDWSVNHDHYLYGTPKKGETK